MTSSSSLTESTPLVSDKSHVLSHHDHPTELDAASKRAQRKLQLACLFSLLFMVAEVVGGFMAGSLAIMTDAAHLLSDVAGFLISLFALWVGSLPANSKMSYGFQRAEVIGAVISVLFIWVLTGCLVYAAVERFMDDISGNPSHKVDGKLMFIVACIGLGVNLILMKILGHNHSHGGSHGHSHGGGHGHAHSESPSHSHGGSHGHSHGGGHGHSHESGLQNMEEQQDKDAKKSKKTLENINIEAAYIHALGDFVQSVGVCIAGGLIWYNPDYQIADPIATFVFSILVLFTTVGIITSSIHVLMEGTPDGIDPAEIEQGLRALPSIVTTHDLHIWSLTVGKPSLSVHLMSKDPDNALHEAQDYLISQGIHHSTIQVENVSKQYPRKCEEIKCGQNSPRKDHH